LTQKKSGNYIIFKKVNKQRYEWVV